jgi:hypothetical protein
MANNHFAIAKRGFLTILQRITGKKPVNRYRTPEDGMNRIRISRILVTALAFLVLSPYVSADVPQYINYQGRLTDSAGDPAADGDYEMTFAIYTKGTVSGESVWTSSAQTVPVSDGLFSCRLGPIPDSVFTSSFYYGSRYLGITVDGYPEASPRTQLVTTPYSFVALRADTATVSDTALNVLDDAITSAKILDGTITRFDVMLDQIHSSHIHDGTILFEDIHQNGAIAGQVMKWDGDDWVAGDVVSGASGWTSLDSVLYTTNYVGIARGGSGNVLYGGSACSHTNLGVVCTTGVDGDDRQYATVGGGYGNSAPAAAATIAGGTRNRSVGIVSAIGGGQDNRASGMYSFVGGGDHNCASGRYSAILGGYADTIESSAGYSFLFGIAGKLTEDSTFMIDMPHIRFGSETDGYEFPTADGASDQVLGTDGSGLLRWVDLSGRGGWVSDTSDGRVGLADSTDQVGIGISEPSAKLHVSE